MLRTSLLSYVGAACLAGLMSLVTASPAWAVREAPPLPPPTGTVVNVSTVSGLMNAISAAVPGTTIMVADGFYDLGTQGHSLSVTASNVTIRGASGNRDAVILKGQGMNISSGSTPTVLHVSGNNVTIADLTLRDAWYHLIQVHGESGGDGVRVYNCRLVDSGEQFIKVSAQLPAGSNKCENGVVEYCLFEFTTTARWYYTHGIDVLNGRNWIIRDCVFRNLRGPTGVLTGGAILCWHKTEGTIVERCEFYECDYGVAFGNSGADPDHIGGVIRNNFFYRKGNFGDVAITCNFAQNFKIHNNTVILNGTFAWVIDYRWTSSTGEILYNITDGTILPRNGGTATLVGNLTNAQPSWFVDHANGDLHLAETAAACINQAAAVAGVTDDVDADPRPIGSAPDIGADEFHYDGDVDRDGEVSVLDIVSVVTAFGAMPGDDMWDPALDIDGDGEISVLDIVATVTNFGKSL